MVNLTFNRFINIIKIALKDLNRTNIYGRYPYVAYDDSFKVVIY